LASSRIAYGEPHGGVTISVVVEHLGHVTQLTLDRQDAANAINIEMALGIAEVIDAFAADPNARVLVVTGAGERSFCVGDPPPRRRARTPSGATTPSVTATPRSASCWG
jgi:1,4-dihydroxy-2-naphthoyl-CoA synthase